MGASPALPASARLYLAAVLLVAVAATAAFLRGATFDPAPGSLALAALGTVLGSRVIAVAPSINLALIHPFVFAALLLDGGMAALGVALTCTLGATLLKKKRMTPSQVAFNLAVILLSTIGAALTYRALLAPGDGLSLERCALPVLAASLVFFLANSLLVAEMLGLERRRGVIAVWREQALWSAPTFLAGGALGLGIALCLLSPWRMLLPVALPFGYLIHWSYRLYSEKLRERQARLDLVEQLNRELEQKVRERTEELSRASAEVARQNARLIELEESRQDLVRMLVHDLKSPLGAIEIGLQLLAEEQPAPRPGGHPTLGLVAEAARKLGRMVQNILTVSRAEDIGMALDPAPVAMERLAREAARGFDASAAATGLAIEVEVRGALPMIEADGSLLGRVLENLLANALDHSEAPGSIVIALEPGPAAGDGDGAGASVRVGVADRGGGVPEELRHAIFEKYTRAGSPGARLFGNQGLGLTFCKLAVQAHGGRIWVEPREGGGSCFWFVVPAVRPGGLREGSLPSCARETESAA